MTPPRTQHVQPQPAERHPDERRLATRNRRRSRSSRELSELFAARDDLRGVSPVADHFVDAVRWSA